MEGNKDAAQNCLDIGNKALKNGDKAKALKFLAKAQRLDPTLPLGTLLSAIRREVNDAGGEDRGVQNEIKQHVSGTAKVNGDAVSNGVASSEQIEIVQRIRKTRDFYQILALSKDCTKEEIRKAYKKISLKVHPDKNSAQGAEDAFKRVSQAFACLNKEDTRAKYDQYGPEDPNRLANQNGARYRNARNGYASGEMFDADEIFNSFFFGTGSAFQRGQYVRRYRTAGSAQAEAGNRSMENSGGLITFVQVLLVVGLVLISLFPLSSPVYSMEQVAPYQFQYSTKAHQVPFYVKSVDFDKDYPLGSSNRRSVEAEVERDMRERLAYSCRRELYQQRWNPTMRKPYCDKLQAFYDD